MNFKYLTFAGNRWQLLATAGTFYVYKQFAWLCYIMIKIILGNLFIYNAYATSRNTSIELLTMCGDFVCSKDHLASN